MWEASCLLCSLTLNEEFVDILHVVHALKEDVPTPQRRILDVKTCAVNKNMTPEEAQILPAAQTGLLVISTESRRMDIP
jgi:hypothetical protein